MSGVVSQNVEGDFTAILKPFLEIVGWTKDPGLVALYQEIVLGQPSQPRDTGKKQGSQLLTILLGTLGSCLLLLSVFTAVGLDQLPVATRQGIIIVIALFLAGSTLFTLFWRRP